MDRHRTYERLRGATFGLLVWALASSLGACGGGVQRALRVAAPGDAAGEIALVRARVPESMPQEGTAIAIAFTPAEVSAGMPEDPSRFADTLSRVQVVRRAYASGGVLALEIRVPSRPALVQLAFDTAGLGLDALFGARPGIALGVIEVGAEGVASGELLGRPFEEPDEVCGRGEREELVVIDAPETAREGDDGQRRVCVQLPRSYASEPERRYPVVFAFPGFSGWHANGDAWRARDIFARVADELGTEVIVVGVGTRTPEGTSYLDRSERFGDWDAFVGEHLVRELDERYRTLPSRGVVGHSTGGWNAVAIATRHPEVFSVVGASSPDALDFDAWMLDERGAVRPAWLAWIRVEDALGGRGQMTSYAAAWSPDASDPRGYAWPVDLASGELRQDVYARWRARSPAIELATPEGRERALRLSGRIAITCGRADEFGLFEPAQRYVEALREAGAEVDWRATELGHFGADEERWAPLARFVIQRLLD